MTYEEQLEAWAKKNQDQKEEWDKAHDRDCKVHDEWMRNEIAIAAIKADYHTASAVEWHRYIDELQAIEVDDNAT